MVAIILFLFSEIALLFLTPRTESIQLLVLYLAMFGAYLMLYQELKNIRTAAFLGVGFRLLAWLAFPALSDDIYRFIWDGSLVLEGFSPYVATPTQFFSENVRMPYETLFPKLNSAHYFSVYPPLIQGIATFGALAANDTYLASLVIKLPLLLAEIASIWMLPGLLLKMKMSPKYSVLYFLNPLIIVDALANAHFEILVVFFLLLTIRQFQTKQFASSAIALALAVGTKLLPLIFLPFVIKACDPKRRLIFLTLFTLACGVLLFPLLVTDNLVGMLQSIQLYYQRFEFNASIYYLLRALFGSLLGYNPIAILGPALAVIQALAIAWLLIKQKPESLKSALHSMLMVNLIYLLLSTTVHPWYVVPLIALGIFNRSIFPLVWSGIIIVSYTAYRQAEYHELLWLVALEYLVVALTLLFPRTFRKILKKPLERL
jgi:hypothetical protein